MSRIAFPIHAFYSGFLFISFDLQLFSTVLFFVDFRFVFLSFYFIFFFCFVSFSFGWDSGPKVTSAQNEICNSPSSDDEVFQECETTFDGTPNTKIVAESGFRAANYSNNTLDSTINFPANIANSTTASAAANLIDRFTRKSDTLNSQLDATWNMPGMEHACDLLPTNSSDGTLNWTIQTDSVESSGMACIAEVDVQQNGIDSLVGVVSDANATITLGSNADDTSVDSGMEKTNGDCDALLSTPDVLHGTSKANEPPNSADILDVGADIPLPSEVKADSVENTKANGTFSHQSHAEEVSSSNSVEHTLSEVPNAAPEELSIRVNDDRNDSTPADPPIDVPELVLDETQNLVEATVLEVLVAAEAPDNEEMSKDPAQALSETVEHLADAEKSTKVADPEEPASSANEAVHVENDEIEPMEVSMGCNETFSEPMDVSMAAEPSARILDETPLLSNPEDGLASAKLNETVSMTNNETVMLLSGQADFSKAHENTFEPNATIILNASAKTITDVADVPGDTTFCAPPKSDEASVNLNETVLVDSKLPNPNTTFFSQPSLDIAENILNQTTGPTNEATFHINSENSRLPMANSTFVAQGSLDLIDELLNQTTTIAGDVTLQANAEKMRMPNPSSTFCAQRSLDVIDETATNGKRSATGRTKPEGKRISFNLSEDILTPPAADKSLNLIETSPHTDEDGVFKVPSAPINSSSGVRNDAKLPKMPSQSSFDLSDDDFQSGGSKFLFLFHVPFISIDFLSFVRLVSFPPI